VRRLGYPMTDERDKSSRGKESQARTTARDVPFMRGADSESEPAPRGQRPAQLPRDPTYEAELAQVELAVLRDPVRRDDPSTKQGGGRRGHQFAPGQPPESVTPESPGTRSAGDATRSPEPPSSSGRAVASGTLLSVGAVDPRGKTERTLETPRMYFSQLEDGGEAYFKPGKIPAVTVHQTLETETVKLADSIDPRRAKTIPRLDRAELARLADRAAEPDSDAAMAMSPSSNFDSPMSVISRPWDQQDYEAASSLGEHDQEGQIHASLSPFRDQGEPSFSMNGAETRPEPYVVRRASDPPVSHAGPEPSAVPTQRDLPHHRIEASKPPPAPASAPHSARARADSAAPFSEGVSPTTASIAASEPERRSPWLNYAAFALALVFALAIGMWLTNGSQSEQASSPDTAKSSTVPLKPAEPPLRQPRAPAKTEAVVAPTDREPRDRAPTAAVELPPRKASAPAPKAPSPAPASPPTAAPLKSPPSKPRETIF
jgi:hypothetical protein